MGETILLDLRFYQFLTALTHKELD